MGGSMTELQIKGAIEQAKVQCDLKMADYEPVSMRGVLYELGYEDDQVQEVLEYCSDQGFNYCLDHSIKMGGHHLDSGRYPDQGVCQWGPDQLKSRLECVSRAPYQKYSVKV
jgi:hypothetical protein